MLYEKAHEWQHPVWVAALDFKKAYDSISHDALWATLRNQEVPKPYVDLLRNLYDGQTAHVQTDRQSRTFQIKCGTKQGDPLSSLLFNALLDDISQQVNKKWLAKKFGIKMGPLNHNYLTNLRFADD
eukprot:11881387-Karenia_brevis.AAC.1